MLRLPAVVECVGFRLDIHDTGGAQAKLRRQSSGYQIKLADNCRVEKLTESAGPLRQGDTVDAKLQVAVFVTDVQFVPLSGILRHARSLQQHLVKRGVGALRQRFNCLVTEFVSACTNRGEDIAARVIQRRRL